MDISLPFKGEGKSSNIPLFEFILCYIINVLLWIFSLFSRVPHLVIREAYDFDCIQYNFDYIGEVIGMQHSATLFPSSEQFLWIITGRRVDHVIMLIGVSYPSRSVLLKGNKRRRLFAFPGIWNVILHLFSMRRLLVMSKRLLNPKNRKTEATVKLDDIYHMSNRSELLLSRPISLLFRFNRSFICFQSLVWPSCRHYNTIDVIDNSRGMTYSIIRGIAGKKWVFCEMPPKYCILVEKNILHSQYLLYKW